MKKIILSMALMGCSSLIVMGCSSNNSRHMNDGHATRIGTAVSAHKQAMPASNQKPVSKVVRKQ